MFSCCPCIYYKNTRECPPLLHFLEGSSRNSSSSSAGSSSCIRRPSLLLPRKTTLYSVALERNT